MEKFLQIVEAPTQPDEVEVDPPKLKFFNSKFKLWNFPKILASKFQNLPLEDKSSILKKYYVDMLLKYSGSKGKIIFCLFSGGFWSNLEQLLSKILGKTFFFCKANFICFQEGKSCFKEQSGRNINIKIIVAATFEN